MIEKISSLSLWLFILNGITINDTNDSILDFINPICK